LFVKQAPREGVQSMGRTAAHESLGAREPQSFKLKRAIMYKVFIVITLSIGLQSYAKLID